MLGATTINVLSLFNSTPEQIVAIVYRSDWSEMVEGRRLVYATDFGLWIGAMAMHWSLLIVLIRHFRLFTNPVPAFVTAVEAIDGFMEIGLPVVYTSCGDGAASAEFRLVLRRTEWPVRMAEYFIDRYVMAASVGQCYLEVLRGKCIRVGIVIQFQSHS